ncbi:MAG: DUF4878 domain-containing protein [Alloprevotella sp.]|nr:DUF4878 domain-containing protein [Alloprevotella sp.]MDY4059140.1 DUF4878 domain-containing protein [Alloprevotella sp.]MDY6113841.1 DUF4878 domain-containing protein [Alloprevotella sp.]
MKKLFSTLAVALVALIAFTACGGHENSPQGVAKAAMEALQSGDAEAYFDLMYGSEESQNREQTVALIKEKAFKSIEAKDGIKSYEIIEPEEPIAADADKATIKVNVFYGNGQEEGKTLRLKKDDNGNWKLRS